MVDLHCHILPGIDDGPTDGEGSVRLAKELRSQGVETVAATPHCRSDHPRVVPAELAERCERVSSLLQEAGIELELVPGGEVDLLWGLEASDEDLRLVSYGQRGETLLLETPYGPLPPPFEELVFKLALKGYRIVLAHPERNPTLQRDPERLADLVRRGTLVQVTASSLVRSPKKSPTAWLAGLLVRNGLAHAIASDAHGPAAPDRVPLGAGAAAAAEMVGDARAQWLVQEAPRAILEDRRLPPQPPGPAPKRGLLSRLGR